MLIFGPRAYGEVEYPLLDVDKAQLFKAGRGFLDEAEIEAIMFPKYRLQLVVELLQRVVWRDTPIVTPYSWVELLKLDPASRLQIPAVRVRLLVLILGRVRRDWLTQMLSPSLFEDLAT